MHAFFVSDSNEAVAFYYTFSCSVMSIQMLLSFLCAATLTHSYVGLSSHHPHGAGSVFKCNKLSFWKNMSAPKFLLLHVALAGFHMFQEELKKRSTLYSCSGHSIWALQTAR